MSGIATLTPTYATIEPLPGQTNSSLALPWSLRLARWASAANAPTAVTRAAALIASWQRLASHLPVHDLLDRIYHDADIPACYLRIVPAAMRPPVNANLEALLGLALTLSGGRYPSLARFLDEIAALRDQAGNDAPGLPSAGHTAAVRLLTIHSAKGLESPIVFLIKADEAEAPEDHAGALLDWPLGERRPSHFSLYGPKAWRGPGRNALFEREAAQAMRERLNLLYVAMTRAAQALFVSGLGDADDQAPAGSWLAQLSEALGRTVFHGLAEMAWQTTPTESFAEKAGRSEARGADAPATPWSGLAPVGTRLPPATPQSDFGTQLHAWLEGATQGLDSDAIRARLGVDGPEADALATMAQRILTLPSLAPAFDPAQYRRAWNEYEVLDPTGKTLRLDRLVEFEGVVWVLDYKTGGLEIDDLAARAAPHLGQMHGYVAAAQALIPAKPVRAALVFGDGGVHWLA